MIQNHEAFSDMSTEVARAREDGNTDWGRLETFVTNKEQI
jgi:hypothetical protein